MEQLLKTNYVPFYLEITKNDKQRKDKPVQTATLNCHRCDFENCISYVK